jgi:hypothetical protein
MSVKLNSLTVSPTLVDSANGETTITLTWNARMTQASDNPVKVELQINPSSEISFVSTQGNEVAEVEWEQDFQQGLQQYSETVVVIVTQPQQLAQTAIIKMTITGANGVSSTRRVNLRYK